jgi:hypothetical protein
MLDKFLQQAIDMLHAVDGGPEHVYTLTVELGARHNAYLAGASCTGLRASHTHSQRRCRLCICLVCVR